MKGRSVTSTVVVIGAGPYGLAAAAHLQQAGIETAVFGEPMSFWRRHMPEGMLLRSSPGASSIADPERRLTVERFAQERGGAPPDPLPLDDFLRYTDWFREKLRLAVDERSVSRVDARAGGFQVLLADGETLSPRYVVVAGGIAPFARRAPEFRGLGPPSVVHSIDIRSTSGFRDKRVVVVGAGQSALETAALLHEAGGDVEVVSRAGRVVWIPEPRDSTWARRIRRVVYAPTEVGPRGVSWVAAVPDVFRRLPRSIQADIAQVCIAPMGAYWLRHRLRDVPLTLGRRVVTVTDGARGLVLKLDDGGAREVDHVVLATGFHVDVRRYNFLSAELVRGLRLANGSPVLTTGLEASVAGLHFIGAPASYTFGPVMRFVVGTWYAAPALTRRIVGRPPPPLIRSW